MNISIYSFEKWGGRDGHLSISFLLGSFFKLIYVSIFSIRPYLPTIKTPYLKIHPKPHRPQHINPTYQEEPSIDVNNP